MRKELEATLTLFRLLQVLCRTDVWTDHKTATDVIITNAFRAAAVAGEATLVQPLAMSLGDIGFNYCLVRLLADSAASRLHCLPRDLDSRLSPV